MSAELRAKSRVDEDRRTVMTRKSKGVVEEESDAGSAARGNPHAPNPAASEGSASPLMWGWRRSSFFFPKTEGSTALRKHFRPRMIYSSSRATPKQVVEDLSRRARGKW